LAPLDLLLLLGLLLRSQLLLHLPLDHGSYFCLGCLLLAGTKYGQGKDQRQRKRVFHLRIGTVIGSRCSN
jgi:hypothetical protein